MPAPSEHTLRIVLTGGPGGGKTTAADLLRREFANRVALVPETATMLFLGGFPRVAEPDAVRSAQTAIFHVQRNLEDVQAARYPGQILLCDRGTVDGAAYWPDGNGDGGFFNAMGTALESELDRTRTRGYALTRGELEEGLDGIAVPLRGVEGAVEAALGVSGPTFRIGERREEFAGLLLERAAAITRDLRARRRMLAGFAAESGNKDEQASVEPSEQS